MSKDDFFGESPELLKTRYDAWSNYLPIENSKVLDLGCNCSTAGEYFLERGSSKYVGVDIDINELKKSKEILENKFDSSKFSLVNMPIDKFLENNNETFDIVLLGVVLHGFGDVIELFRKIVKITNQIVIETAQPFYSYYRLKSDLLSSDDLNNLEYNHATVEVHNDPSKDHLIFLHSMKYLSIVFNRLGFIENYKPYEKLKKELPNIYGFDLNSQLGLAKRYVVIFNKTKWLKELPITWKETFNEF